MNTQHTPGPWLLNKRHHDHQTRLTIGGWHCLTLSAVPEGDAESQTEIMEANARLIAAAPELLAALDIIATGNTDPDRVVEIAREAIAKAQGGAV